MSTLLLAETVLFLLLALLVGTRRRGAPLLIACLIALVATGAFAWQSERGERVEDRRRLLSAVPHLGRDEFVSSDACRACHPSQHATWHRSFHRTMTQLARPETVRGPFDGTRLVSRGRSYELARRGEEHWVRMVDPDWERQERLAGRDVDLHPDPPYAEHRVVMLTGSHHMQTYWVPSSFGREVYNLPFVYLFADERFVPREDVFLRPPDAPRFVGLWNNSCIECHATGGKIGFDFEREVFDSGVAELGISCEACHGPAVEHALANRNPWRRYRLHFLDRGDSTLINPERLSPRLASHLCGQCHGVWLAGDELEWLAEGHTFRPGDDLEDSRLLVRPAHQRGDPRLADLVQRSPDALVSRFWSDGMVRVSGREMSGMIESPCFTDGRSRREISCLSCHSMHESDPDDQLAAGMAGDGACLKCHGEIGGRLAEHTHHPVSSAGSSCYNCHMPHTTYGLLKAIRSHQISSPTVAESVEVGRPNACNLCHLDQTLGWTNRHLAEWYGTEPVALSPEQESVAASLLWLLAGDAGQRALVAWSMGWEPAREASGEQWLPLYLGSLLTDPYAAVRYIARRSLATLPGNVGLGYDFIGAPEERAAARRAVIQGWIDTHPQPLDRSGRHLLIDRDGNPMLADIARLAQRRDDRPLFLAE